MGSSFRLRYVLLVVPFVAYLYPAFYDRMEPRVFGFPFFYAYQLAWVAATSLLVAAVLLLGRSRQ